MSDLVKAGVQQRADAKNNGSSLLVKITSIRVPQVRGESYPQSSFSIRSEPSGLMPQQVTADGLPSQPL